MAEHNEFGKSAERVARVFLEERGYTVLEQNYRYLKAEVDLIVKKGTVVAIVEVKARSTKDFGPIAETVTPKKIRLLVMAADHYMQSRELDDEVRFDIVTLYRKGGKWEIDHLKDAFYYF